jgi:2-polyprenyl-6-methoxyphenol hydroxylase-like FAD-dependent oxidoreductase
VARPRGECRLLVALMAGQRGELLRRPDPALHDYLVGRFPALAPLQFSKTDAHVYRLSRHWAERFWAPGAALVGDAAHGTHPAGASGMSLAITDAALLGDLAASLLAADARPRAMDEALEAYDAARRPAAMSALAATHAQALRQWESNLYRDAEAFARAVDPQATYGAGGAGWGQNPGAVVKVTRGVQPGAY